MLDVNQTTIDEKNCQIKKRDCSKDGSSQERVDYITNMGLQKNLCQMGSATIYQSYEGTHENRFSQTLSPKG